MHYWWHEMARNYHEPEPFRYSLEAFVQAARNVTWVLQKEKRVFEDFSWYEEWAARAIAVNPAISPKSTTAWKTGVSSDSAGISQATTG